ncbi:hypothetical protein BCR35DRAFT_333835 [Leucosporidium creatinivorum]|uniref:Uncharacterized protein n=1 Tax=Leucosporidium creatinivorum TaxID=106004 RepID=A0A1Y2ENI8_9BASI|nr:hypothetical protein BCR35DRAFT_333835 [Leucosporidium creatinivorum]
MGKGLNQRSAARWLQRAANAREIEEVLSAYVFCKMRAGTTPAGTCRKLHLLQCYLFAINLGYLVNQYRETWDLLNSEVQHYDGGLVGATPTISSLGNELWNEVRRGNPTRSPSSLSLGLFKSRTRDSVSSEERVPRVRVREGAVASPDSEVDLNWGAAGPGAAILLRSARVTEGPRRHDRGAGEASSASRLPVYEAQGEEVVRRDSVDELPLYA